MQPVRDKTFEQIEVEPKETVAQKLAKSGQERALERGESVTELDDASEDLKADQDPKSDVMDDAMIKADESNLPKKVHSDHEFNRVIDSDVHGDSPNAEDHKKVLPSD